MAFWQLSKFGTRRRPGCRAAWSAALTLLLCFALVSFGSTSVATSLTLLGMGSETEESSSEGSGNEKSGSEEPGSEAEGRDVLQLRSRPRLSQAVAVTLAPLSLRSAVIHTAAASSPASHPQPVVHLIGSGIRILC